MPSVFELQRAAMPKADLRPIWAVLAVGATAPLVAAFWLRDQIVPLATISGAWAIVVGLIAFMRAAKPIGSGEEGERMALRSLESLPDEYLAITNCKIPTYEQIGDLDIVVVGPHGIAVVEVKRFLRRVVVDGDQWTGLSRYSPTPMRSVSKQLRSEVQALTKYLGGQQINTPVHGIIAINPNALLEVATPPPYPIVPYDALADAVLKLPPARTGPQLDVIERKLCSTATTT